MRNQLLMVALVAMLCCPYSLCSQQQSLSGHLALDLSIISQADVILPENLDDVIISEKKSVWLAGGLSLIVPGAGQVYADAPWWRTAIYGVAEVAGWAMYGIYQAKGDDATTQFEQFADQHWDVTRYVNWIASNYQGWSDQQVDKTAAAEALATIYRSTDPSLPPWERVDFQQLRKLESAVKDDFTHTLPNHGEQQYYEQVGKYVQYRSGWDDHIPNGDTVIYNPSRVTERNRSYTLMRLDANDLLGYAQTGIVIIAINHLTSMVDAALTAHSHNVKITSGMNGLLLPNGHIEIVPMMAIGIKF